MEKIRSGQAFLYREEGLESTVIDVRMEDTICYASLRKAINKSFSRYPYFTQKFIEKNGDFYLVENPLPFILKETLLFHSLGSLEVNYHLIDITYYDKSICIAFHHGLCDGRGIKPFIETLLFYYCTFKYNQKFNVENVRLADGTLLKNETAEPFNNKFSFKTTPTTKVTREGYSLPHVTNKNMKNNYYRYEIKLNHKAFMKLAKENNATPSVLMSLLTSKAIKSLFPDADKPILCNLASDMRKELNMDNTFKNCVGSIYLPYSNDLETLSLLEQATTFRKIIKVQKQDALVRSNVNTMIGLNDKLDELNSYEKKKNIMSFFNNITLNTFIISYLGQTKLGDCEKYIDSMHMYSSGTNGLVMNILSIGEYITVDFLQSFEADIYINALIDLMKKEGLDFTVSKKIQFETPRDSYENYKSMSLTSDL